MVAIACPCSSMPSNGVLRPLEWNRAACTVQRRVGSTTRNIGGRTRSQRAERQAEDARWGNGHRRDDDVQRDLGFRRHAQGQRQRRFESDHAVERPIELDFLLIAVMRCVIAGDRVDGAVGEASAHRVDIKLGAQRRMHLGVGIVACHGGLGEREVMRRHFGGHRQPPRLWPRGSTPPLQRC